MSVTDTYFRGRIDECHALARRASRKDDRQFWEAAAQRWQRVLDQYTRPAAPRAVPERVRTRNIAGRSKEAA
jgi:hypothetical protein